MDTRLREMSSTTAKKKPTYHVLENGFIIPTSFVKEFERSLKYIPERGDIFICTYPKCGTTWTQCILCLMISKGEPLKEGQSINNFIPFLDEDGLDAVLAFPKPRMIKTHLPFDMLPKSKEAKYIFVGRNPKDCCVSYYHHTKGFERCYDFADGKFEDYFELFLAGEVDYGDYFDHLLSYLPHKNDPNMLFLLYEEMKSDIRGCIRKIGEFLGGSFRKSCEDPIIFEKILLNSQFAAMKSIPTVWPQEQAKGSAGFIRKGAIGDWKTHFKDEQSKLMDEKFTAKLAGTEAENFWDKYDC